MEKSQKVSPTFYCETCDYTTGYRCDYKKHLTTRKHFSNVSTMRSNGNSQKVSESPSQNNDTTGKKQYVCEICDKTYCDNSGLWRHKKSCVGESKETPNQSIPTELVIELIKQNKELQAFIFNELKPARS